eukprot:COSAG02_NODE_14858_length_1229_cov_1.208850_1_plen_255_part_10
MTPVERQAAAEAQFIRQGQQEDAEEEKLMRYATASEAQLYALPADALVAAVDGGHTAEGAGKAGPDAPETVGFGFSVHKVWLPEAPLRKPVQRRRKRPSELRRLKGEEHEAAGQAWEMATEEQREGWASGGKEAAIERWRTHSFGHFALGPAIGAGFGPVILDPQDPHFVGCLRRSANTAEITAQVQALLWFREHRRQHLQALTTLCILYDSQNAFQAISCDVPPVEHAAAAATGQGLRRWLETDGVTVNFIWTK